MSFRPRFATLLLNFSYATLHAPIKGSEWLEHSARRRDDHRLGPSLMWGYPNSLDCPYGFSFSRLAAQA